jgi:ABC-type glutathione transport system ATPase component
MATDLAPHEPIVSSDAILEVVDYSGGFVAVDGTFKPVLEDVSFGIARGAMTALVGETGSGKTLTALSMLGIQPRAFRRTSGSIMFEGQDLTTLDAKALQKVRGKQIAMVFQDARTAFNPVFTIGTQIRDVARAHQSIGKKEALEATKEALNRVRIPDPRRCIRQYPHELSGGLAQRAQLAMALICEPTLLILDEPTTGLDVTIQADIMELIVDLNRSGGMSTLLITHDLGVVAESCDRVVVMQHGRVREVGTCEQIINRPDDSYTQMLIAASRVHEGMDA